MLEVASKLFPACVSLLEGKIFPQLLVEKLIDRGVGIDTGTWIAVPVPDPTRGGTLLVDFD